jgi:serine/threonine-protein kinase
MGVVYRAIDLDLDREIAIKTLPRTSVRESMRLRREAQVMARLVHPNLAAIFGLETWRGVPMLIVEFLPGGTLADRLRCGPLSVKEAIELGRALAAGLASMHSVALLHRDIKPNNIGFQIDQTPKLLDFGLAQLLSEPGGSGPSSTSSVPDRRISSLDRMGTPAYAPPARYRLDADDPVRDLWSLSLVLYEAIAGINPMVAPDEDSLVSTPGRREISSLLQHVPACPPEVAAFLSHALSPNAAERPRTARAFVAALIELDRLLP